MTTTCLRCGAQYLNMPYALCIPCWRETGAGRAIAEESEAEEVVGWVKLAAEVVHGERVEVERRWRIG